MAFTRFTQTVVRMVSRAITTAEATLPKTLFKIPLENPSPFFSANPVPTFHCSNSTLAKALTRQPPRYDLQDKIALITNSSTGPSRALAIRLGAAGARVICVDYYPHAQPISFPDPRCHYGSWGHCNLSQDGCERWEGT
jgi:hypothetical protein